MTDIATSRMGIAFLERGEGVVLKAYLCPANKWTIGAGLTAASGVVVPKAGMTITREEASRLLGLALARNYEPAVRAAMPGSNQHEFDGGISFHFNTGAIGRASWVKAWRARDWVQVWARLRQWRKGGGKVLPGLERRRETEFRLMREGLYGGEEAQPAGRGIVYARIALPLDAAEIEAARAALRRLGYDPGPAPGEIEVKAVVAFQAAHDLTPDGILGRATLSTLQRRIDARARAAAPAATGAAGAATEAGSDQVAGLSGWAGDVLLLAALAWGLWLAWTYRDVIAARVEPAAPGLAAWLRRL